MNKPKILALDIETAPITAYVWRLWDQNVGLNQIVDNGGIICVGAQFVGEKTGKMFSEWEHGKEEMLKQVHSLLMEADAVLTYNGDSFDLKKLRGEFIMHGLDPLPQLTSIDLLKVVKKFGLISNKLAFVGPLFGVGSKIKHEGFELWSKVIDGNTTAQKKMAKYCAQDVKLLIDLYNRLKPHITNHPHLGEDTAECGCCGSKKSQSRGYRRTKSFKIQRHQCMNCGSWFDGKRTKV